MAAPVKDAAFAGSIPQVYASNLVPLIFEDYARDIARRVAAARPRRVLELACGTGVVTRELLRVLPADCELVATDLNPAMLEEAKRGGTARPVEFQPADAQALPFPDASFDAVVVQYGVMFFPDKPKAHAEARRVLKPGGLYVFNVWDGLPHNDVARLCSEAMEPLFPQDPPRFLARTPYGYSDPAKVSADVVAGGFGKPTIETLAFRSRAPSAGHAAIGYCHGTPLRGEIEARDPQGLPRATAAATAAVAKALGGGAIDAKIQALVVTARK